MNTISNEERRKEHTKNFVAFQKLLEKDSKLLKNHEGEYAVVYKGKIEGIYRGPFEAKEEAEKKHKKNEIFSIQEITEEMLELGWYRHVLATG